jgi:hypothetical protein
MAIKLKSGRYKCMLCDFTALTPFEVDNEHTDKVHDYVLVPMLISELQRLMQFIMTKDDTLLTEELYTKIREYSRYRKEKKK